MGNTRSQSIQSSCLAVLTLALLCCTSCGPSRIRTYPATGQVTQNGKPCEGVEVIFVPRNGAEEFMAQRPYGVTDADGTFTLTTFEKGDGAPAGEYVVTMTWYQALKSDEEGLHAGRGDKVDRFKNKYERPSKSELKAVVEKGENQLPVIDVD